MKKYRKLQVKLASFLGLMFVLGELALFYPPNYEVFPFYSWSMFALVPGKTDSFSVIIHESEGKTFSPPLMFQKAQGVVNNPHSITAQKFIQKFGKAIRDNNEPLTSKYRRHFEENYLQANTRYEVIYEKIDPLERRKQKRSSSFKSLVTWSTKTP